MNKHLITKSKENQARPINTSIKYFLQARYCVYKLLLKLYLFNAHVSNIHKFRTENLSIKINRNKAVVWNIFLSSFRRNSRPELAISLQFQTFSRSV